MVDTLVVVVVVAGTVAVEVDTGTEGVTGTEAVVELSLVALGSVEDFLRKDNRIMIFNSLKNKIEYHLLPNIPLPFLYILSSGGQQNSLCNFGRGKINKNQ